MKLRHKRLSVESLENRETPATLVNAMTLTYQDIDGDNVTVTLSKPLLEPGILNAVFGFSPANGFADNTTPQQLQAFNVVRLGSAAAAGLSITVRADRDPVRGGDGFAAVGEISAPGISLNRISIDGDLGRVQAGDISDAPVGLMGLTVHSLGRFGTSTGAPDLHTVVNGALSFLRVKTDLSGAIVEVIGDNGIGRIGSVFVGGSILNLGVDFGGYINAESHIGKVEILGSIVGEVSGGVIQSSGNIERIFVGGSVRGGADDNSGTISAGGRIGTVRIGGSLIGGNGNFTGKVSCSDLGRASIGGRIQGGFGIQSGRVTSDGPIGRIQVGHDVIGGGGQASGRVDASVGFGSVTIGGSLIGGKGNGSGSVFANETIGRISIAGDVIGGTAFGSLNLENSGVVFAGAISVLTVAGTLFAGVDSTTGNFLNNGAVRVDNRLGQATFGAIQGNLTNPAIVSARGQLNTIGSSDLAIRRLAVKGNVELAQILAGVDRTGTPINADAQIGGVTVGGNWIATSVAAGAAAANGLFGDGDDAKIAGPTVKDVAGVTSAIRSLIIQGQAIGSLSDSDHFGIVAESIGIVQIGGTTIPTSVGAGNDDFFVGVTGDFKINEI